MFNLILLMQELTVSDALIALDVRTYTKLFAKSVGLIRSNFSTFETVQTTLRSSVNSIGELNEKVRYCQPLGVQFWANRLETTLSVPCVEQLRTQVAVSA
jgi:hypothetical protein